MTPGVAIKRGFGLDLQVGSGVVLDELPDRAATGPPAHECVSVVRGVVESAGAERIGGITVHDREILTILRRGSSHLITTPDQGRYEYDAAAGALTCDASGVTRDWEPLLTAQVLPFVSALGGLEPFHASAVAIADQAWLLIGPSGAGKTTLAAHLIALADAQLIADDVAAVELGRDGALQVHNSGRYLHLDPALADHLLGLSPSTLVEAGYRDGIKRRLMGAQPAHVLPLGGVILLDPVRDGELAVTPVADVPPWDLLGSTFVVAQRSPERLARQLEICHAIARTVRVYRLSSGANTTPRDAALALAGALRS
jgi:hypothetical protein